MELAFAMAYELLSGMTRLFRENREELDSLLSAASNMIRSMDALLTRHADRIDRIIENVETISNDANELVSGANDMVNGPEVRRIVRNVDHTLASVSRDIDPLLSDARSIAGKVDDLLDMIGPDQQREIQSTIHDASEIAHDANGMLDEANEIVTHIRQGRGTAGALLMDEEIYDDIQEMLRDLKHNPWKLFWRE
jgi:phospholipid/cholesterol/gamma-HCH transport system substrate-binding protein